MDETKSMNDGVVYLHQYPRSTNGPNTSPFCLKLELFLRMTKLPYEVIESCEGGPKGKVPFIEMDGQTVADSDFIVDFLTKKFGLTLDDKLDATQAATAHAVQQMVEENTYWTFGYHQAIEKNLEGMAELFKPNPGIAMRLLVRFGFRNLKENLRCQGIGRHTPEEVRQIVAKDLRSLSAILGSKKYLFSDSAPSSVDAAVFGQLALPYYHAPDSYHHRLMQGEFSNLGQYVESMRSEFFPDWDELSLR